MVSEGQTIPQNLVKSHYRNTVRVLITFQSVGEKT